MKRLALLLAASSVVWFSAFAGGAVQAYQPVEPEEFFADPFRNAPGAEFDAVVKGCFPGEQVMFTNLGVTPNETASANCGLASYEARVTFQAPDQLGAYEITAFLAAEQSNNPDIPDRPERFLEALYVVSNGVIVLEPGPGDGGLDGGAAVMSAGGSGDIWPSFLSAAGFYRTFLALLALLAGIFFVVLWRRRREDEQLTGTYGYGTMPPPDPGNPSMA